MARYNTSLAQGTQSSGTNPITTPAAGQLTEFTGTAPYIITIPDPTIYQGVVQSFYNNTSPAGNVTLQTPSGTFIGPGGTASNQYILPTQCTVTLSSDGAAYILQSQSGGNLVATTSTFGGLATFNNNVQLSGTYVRASSAFTPSATYDLTTLTYIQTVYGQTWSVQGSSFTATAGGRYFCSGGITITLPASPNVGDMVQIVDYNGNFNSSNITVNPQSNKIMRQATTMTVSTAGAAFTLVYSGSTNGWLMANGI
jgi:hypothetical protein